MVWSLAGRVVVAIGKIRVVHDRGPCHRAEGNVLCRQS